MTDIREQVAKALFEDGYKPAKWFDAMPSMKTDFRHIASVAIDAYEKARGLNEGGPNIIVPRLERFDCAASQKDTDT